MKTNDGAKQIINGLGIASTALYRGLMAQAAIVFAALGVLMLAQ